MALLKFGKKKEEKKSSCCCCSSENTTEICYNSDGEIKSIKVLGAGCKSCHEQYEYAKEAVKNIGLSLEVEYITDMQKVMEYGVISMPAIVVNEKVVAMGKVLKPAELEKTLIKY